MCIYSWIYARCFYKNVNYSNFEEQKRPRSAKNNYRPTAIVTAMSKIFELCLSRIMDAYILQVITRLALNENTVLTCVFKLYN